MTDHEFLTIKEAAFLLRFGHRTTYEMARTGRLPGAVKIGVQWRVNKKDLMAWLDSAAKRARITAAIVAPDTGTECGEATGEGMTDWLEEILRG